MMNSEGSTRELTLLRERLSAIVAPVRIEPTDAERLRHRIEERAERLKRHRRMEWTTLAAVVSVLTVFAFARLPATHAPVASASRAAAPVTAAGRQTVVNHSQAATVFDLGPNVGKLLVRPATSFAYDPDARSVELFEGSIVAHIQPGGRGFRVTTSTIVVRVTGTLFGVAGESTVRVWHGSVVKTSRSEPSSSETLTGDERYDDLRAEELSWLAFEPAGREGVASCAASTCPEPPASTAPAGSSLALPRHASAPGVRTRKESPPELPVVNPERRLLLDAQARLAAGSAEAALELLAEHERLYRGSVLAEERDLLSLRALVLTHDAAALTRQAQRFLVRYPSSSRAAEVRALGGKE